MKVRANVITIVVLAAVAFASFEIGRRNSMRHFQATRSGKFAGNRNVTNRGIVDADVGPASLDIRGIGNRPFAEIYPIVRAASVEQRSAWAKQLDEMPDGPRKWAANNFFYKTVAQIDPAEAVKLALGIQREMLRMGATGAIGSVMPYRSMPELIKIMQTFPRQDIATPDGKSDYFGEMIEGWSIVDPTGAAAFIEAHPEENTSVNRTSLVRWWAGYDPVAAKTWLDRTMSTDSQEREESQDTMKALLKGWFENDQAGAIDFAVANQEQENFLGGIGAIASTLLAVSPDSAADFINRLDENVRMNALTKIVRPDDYDYSPVPGQPTRHENQDIQPAPTPETDTVVNWLLQFSSEESNPAIARLLAQWKTEQPQELLKWMGELPSTARGRIVDIYAVSMATSPAEISTIAGLSDIGLRDELLEALMPQLTYMRDKALDALKSAPLSAAQKDHLASLIPNEPDTESEPELEQ